MMRARAANTASANARAHMYTSLCQQLQAAHRKHSLSRATRKRTTIRFCCRNCLHHRCANQREHKSLHRRCETHFEGGEVVQTVQVRKHCVRGYLSGREKRRDAGVLACSGPLIFSTARSVRVSTTPKRHAALHYPGFSSHEEVCTPLCTCILRAMLTWRRCELAFYLNASAGVQGAAASCW
jgi:hypothetical protein